MSLNSLPTDANVIELSDAASWAVARAHGAPETTTSAVSLDPMATLVPLQLEDVLRHHSASEKKDYGWKNKLSTAFRINTSAGDMKLPRAILLVGLSFFFVLTTSLLVTGFQGLLPALIKDGVYANLCPPSNATIPAPGSVSAVADYVIDTVGEIVDSNQVVMFAWKRSGAPGGGKSEATCDRQRLRLNLMLTVSVTLLNLICFPLGIMVDRWGPRWVGVGGSLVTILGSLLFAFSDSRKFDMFIPAYALIGSGGVCIFMSLLHLVNIFPEYRGVITTLYTAVEDASTGVFYFFRRLHSAGFSLRTLFISYCAIPVAHFFVVLLQPKRPVINEKTSENKEFYPVSLLPLRKQALSPQFIAVLIWNGLMGVTTYFYLSTLSSQLIWLFGSQEAADRGTEIFSFLFMICPFVAVPFTGWIIDAFGTWPSLLFVALQALTYGALSCVRVWWLQYIAWGAFVVTRASFIGVSTHWVNQMFGENFSTLIGFVWTIGGVCNFSNQLWVYIAINHLRSNFLGINIIMTIIAVSSTIAAALLVRGSLGERGNEMPLALAVSSGSLSDDSVSSLSTSDSSDALSDA